MAKRVPRYIDEVSARTRLLVACNAAGNQKAWAEARGILPSQLSMMISGSRRITDKALAAIGLRRVTAYEVLDG